jgi:hypothetical protein
MCAPVLERRSAVFNTASGGAVDRSLLDGAFAELVVDR